VAVQVRPIALAALGDGVQERAAFEALGEIAVLLRAAGVGELAPAVRVSLDCAAVVVGRLSDRDIAGGDDTDRLVAHFFPFAWSPWTISPSAIRPQSGQYVASGWPG
jgi:hypothetical protein